MAGNDLVWPLIADATQFVNGMNQARREAERTRDSVSRDMQQMRQSMNDAYMNASAMISQRMQADREEAARRSAAVSHGSNVFFSGTNSISASYQQEEADREQRLAMARKSRVDADAYQQSRMAGAASSAQALLDRQAEAEQRLMMAQKVRADAERHHEQQRLAMKARVDAAYDQQVAQEKRLAAIQKRDDAATSSALELTRQRRNARMIVDEAYAEMNTVLQRRKSTEELNNRARLGYGGGSGSYGLAIQQLAYGIEDASTQYGTMGIAGAIRGGANNISAAAAMINPAYAILGSAVSTVAILGTQWLTSGDESKSGAEKAKKAIDDLAKTHQELEERVRRAGEAIDERNRKIKSFQSSAGIKEEIALAESQRQKAEQEYIFRKRAAEEFRKTNAKPLAEVEDAQFYLEQMRRYGRDSTVLPTQELEKAFNDMNNAAETAHAKMMGLRDFVRASNEDMEKMLARENQANIFKADVAHLSDWGKQREEVMRKSESDAKSMAESLMTPREKYQRDIKNLEEMRKHNPFIVSEDMVKKAAERARESYQKEMDKGVSPRFEAPKYVDARNSDALSNYYRSINGPRGEQLPEYQGVGFKPFESLLKTPVTGMPKDPFGVNKNPFVELGNIIGKAVRDAMKAENDESKKQTALLTEIKVKSGETIVSF